MNVVVAGIPALLREVDPPLELEPLVLLGPASHHQFPAVWQVFRAAGPGDLVGAGWEQQVLPTAAVDLGMEEEVGGEPPTLRRVDAATRVADQEAGHRVTAVGVDFGFDFGFHVKLKFNATFQNF